MTATQALTPYTLERARAHAEASGAYVQGGEKALFHVSAPVGWINDPNGFSLYRGRTHLFFQHHPYSALWGPMHWGHVVTDDFVRWELLPEALAPDQPYERGCFSGSAVQFGERQALIYTSHLETDYNGEAAYPVQTQSVAFGDGVDYVKHPGNPVIRSDQLPEDAKPTDFRDPKVWEEDGVFYLVAGSLSSDGSGQVLLYRSENLTDWKYMGVVDRSRNRLGKMWECPDFFRLDGQDVLLLSPQHMQADSRGLFHGKSGTAAIVGTLDRGDMRFVRRSVEPVDYGWDFYAPQTMLTEDGRRVMIAWMQSWDNNVTPPEQTWTGMMTFPRELRLQGSHLVQLPVQEIEHYYVNRRYERKILNSGKRKLAFGRSLDFTLTVFGAADAVFTLAVASDEHYETRVVYNAPGGMLTIDRTHSGMIRDRVHVFSVPLREVRETVKLRVLLDRWSMELFLNDGDQAVTTLLYTPGDAQDVLLRTARPVNYAFECHEISIPEVQSDEC